MDSMGQSLSGATLMRHGAARQAHHWGEEGQARQPGGGGVIWSWHGWPEPPWDMDKTCRQAWAGCMALTLGASVLTLLTL